MKKKTHDEYVAELAIKNPNIEVIDRYVDANTKIMHHCLTHDIFWKTTPSRALQGVGCEECRKWKFREVRCKTNEQYIIEVSNISPHIIPLEPYIDAKTPILHKCLLHSVEWMVYPDNVLRGCGCYKCGYEKTGDKNRKLHEKYIEELKTKNRNIIVVETYIDALTPILHKCLIDGYEWKASPANLLFGTGCPKCGGTLQLTTEEYRCRLKEINPNIVAIEDYINAQTKIKHLCLLDDFIWVATPASILHGCGCPKCNESHGEKNICKWLNKHDISYIQQKTFVDCKDKRPLPFDFYLLDYNCCIEFDGKQHYEPIEYFGGQESLEYIQRHDKIKTEYCQNNNIALLRISYLENIEEKLNNFLFI